MTRLDIEFDEKRATECEYMYNEIMPHIIEKQKILEANERLVYQFLELLQKRLDDVPKTYRCPKKSQEQKSKIYKNLHSLHVRTGLF